MTPNPPPEINKPRAKPTVHGFLVTDSLHLATLLSTIGAKPLDITRGPEITAKGDLKVRWTFEPSPLAEEAIHMWNNIQPSPDWGRLTKEQRAVCIDLVSAFTGNMRHFIAHAKGSR